MTAFSAKQQAFLDEAHNAIVATIDREGNPSQSIVWYARDGDNLWVSVGPTSVKARHIAANPTVSVLVLNAAGNRYLRVTGTAKIAGSLTAEDRRALVVRYVGEEKIEGWLADHPVVSPNAQMVITPTHVAEYNLG